MDIEDVLVEAFGRVEEGFRSVADGLEVATLNTRPGADGAANPVGWLLWHLARVQDDHVAGLSGEDQAWDSWRERFGLSLEDYDTGYGHSREQVDAVRIEDARLLLGYHAHVHAITRRYLDRVDGDELERIVDRRWDPPVTAGVRLVSVLQDCLMHLGQAAYVRGLLTM